MEKTGLTCQQVCQKKRSEVINLHSNVKAIFSERISQARCSGVVDQDVQPVFSLVDLLGELPDGLQAGQVQVFAQDVLVVGLFDDFFYRLVTVVLVGYYHPATTSCQGQGSLETNTWN